MSKLDLGRKRERRSLARREHARKLRAAAARRETRAAARVHLDQAKVLGLRGHPREALVHVRAALRLTPDDVAAHAVHYETLRMLRTSDPEVLAPLRAMYDLGERYHRYFFELFLAETRHGDLERAESLLAEMRRLAVPEAAVADFTGELARARERRAGRPERRKAAPSSVRAEPSPPEPPRAVPGSPVEPASPPPAASALPVSIETGVVGLERLLARSAREPWDPLPRLRLSLEAHEIAARERFDELLCLPHLSGVQRFWYQIETVKRVLRSFRGRVLLADEVGLGKTIEAGMVLKEYQLRGLVKRALVLVPPGLVGQWRGELASKLGIASAGSDDPELARDPDAYLAREPVLVASLALARHERHRDRFLAQRYDLIVVDEAHRLKDHRTEGYALVDRLKSRFLLLLTATPIETDLMELFNLVTLLRPGQFHTRASFRKEFVDRGDPSSPRNRERLRQLLREVMVRNTRALSAAPLPPRLAVTVVVEPAAAEAELYARVLALVREAPAGLGSRLLARAGSSPAALAAAASRLDHLQAADIAARARALARTRKDERLSQIVQRGDGQVVVFAGYRSSLEHVAGALRAHGIDAAEIRPGAAAREKDQAVERFRAGVPVLIATDAGAEGLNLQFAATLVNYDLPWNPMLIEQRIGRLHRIGQVREVKVWNLCSRGTAEDQLLDVLDRRLNLFELVVGEMDMVLGYLADDRDFEQIVADIYREAKSPEEVSLGFDRVADQLLAARGRYERVKRFDETLLGEDYSS